MEEPHARPPIPLRPVPAELRLLRLRQHVESQPQILLIRQPVHRRRVPVHRELQRGLHLQIRVPPRRGLEVHDDDAARSIAQVSPRGGTADACVEPAKSAPSPYPGRIPSGAAAPRRGPWRLGPGEVRESCPRGLSAAPAGSDGRPAAPSGFMTEAPTCLRQRDPTPESAVRQGSLADSLASSRWIPSGGARLERPGHRQDVGDNVLASVDPVTTRHHSNSRRP